MIKRRNMLTQVLLVIVTLGIYSIYWFYVTSKEMVEHNGRDGSPGLWTVLLFIPIVSFYSYWKQSAELETFTGGRYPLILIFLLWIIFSPAVWAITQLELNKLATEGARP